MIRTLRNACGLFLVVGALGVLSYAVMELRGREYVGAIVLVLTGLSVLQAGVELLKPSLGE